MNDCYSGTVACFWSIVVVVVVMVVVTVGDLADFPIVLQSREAACLPACL